MRNVIYTIGILIIFINSMSNSGVQCHDQIESLLKGDYFGQEFPDSIPEVFAPGIISISGCSDFICSIHSSMELIVWTSGDGRDFGKIINRKYKRLFCMKRVNNIWGSPQQLLLSQEFSEEEGIFSCDGTRLYYSSNRPNLDDTDLWYVEISQDDWKQPQKLEIPYMPEGRQIYVTTTNDGTLYFNSRKTKGDDKGYYIYRSKKMDEKFSKPELLMRGSHPFISPDESFILLNTFMKDNGYGESDIYICFKLENGTFTKPINMGGEINTKFHEACPTLSPDGKYIFFSRYDEPNENCNVYWVSSRIIEKIEREYKKNEKNK